MKFEKIIISKSVCTKTASCILILILFLFFLLLSGCNFAPGTNDFPVIVTVEDKYEGKIKGALVKIDGEMTGTTNQEGYFATRVTRMPGSRVCIEAELPPGYSSLSPQKICETLKEKPGDYDNEKLGLPIVLRLQTQKKSTSYLLMIKSNLADVPVILNDSLLGNLNNRGVGQFLFLADPGEKIIVTIDSREKNVARPIMAKTFEISNYREVYHWQPLFKGGDIIKEEDEEQIILPKKTTPVTGQKRKSDSVQEEASSPEPVDFSKMKLIVIDLDEDVQKTDKPKEEKSLASLPAKMLRDVRVYVSPVAGRVMLDGKFKGISEEKRGVLIKSVLTGDHTLYIEPALPKDKKKYQAKKMTLDVKTGNKRMMVFRYTLPTRPTRPTKVDKLTVPTDEDTLSIDVIRDKIDNQQNLSSQDINFIRKNYPLGHKNRLPAYSLLARHYLRNKNYHRVVKLYEDLLKEQAYNYQPDVLLNLAVNYAKIGKYNKAIATFVQVERYKRKFPRKRQYKNIKDMYSVWAGCYEHNYYQEKNPRDLDQAIRTWKKYITHISRDEPGETKRAQNKIGEIEKLLKQGGL